MNFCSSCGAALTGDVRFCSSCGTATGELAVDQAPAVPATPKTFTKRFFAVLGVVGLLAVGGGAAFAATRGGGETFEECIADPEKPNYQCQGLPHGASVAQADDSASDTGDSAYQDCVETQRAENIGVQGAGLSEAEIATGCQPGGAFRAAGDCHDDASCAATEAAVEAEGYDDRFTCVYPQPGIAGMIGVRMSCSSEAEQAVMFGQIASYIYGPLGRRPTPYEVEATIMTPGTPSYVLVKQIFPNPADAEVFKDWVWQNA